MKQGGLIGEACRHATLLAAWRQVKGKNAAGGIDGVSLAEFEEKLHAQLDSLASDLRKGQWKPLPYLLIEVSKKNKTEKRELGLLAVRDKVAQCALKSVVEPRAERLFVGNSYAYRPGRSAAKAIRRALQECNMRKSKWVVKLDIDDFFDNIDHDILQARLHALLPDPELVRLLMLVVKMGKVSACGVWKESAKGIPQGSVLSPLLANVYLHSLDQFVLYRKWPYVRYADDFLIFCETQEQATEVQASVVNYLESRLHLSLNPPLLTSTEEGIEFLGITLKKHSLSISDNKRQELLERIADMDFDAAGLSTKSRKLWDGMRNYYAQLLPQTDLELFDEALCRRINAILDKGHSLFPTKTALQRALVTLYFLSGKYASAGKAVMAGLVDKYLVLKGSTHQKEAEQANRKIIDARKREYRRKEAEACELLVNKPGLFIGLTNKGVTVRDKGKVCLQQPMLGVSHIVVAGKGVSLSSNLLENCMAQGVPVDIFDNHGAHIGSFLSPRFMEGVLWQQQALASTAQKGKLALAIVTGKLKNQFGLIKYFHKYHKTVYANLQERYDAFAAWMNAFKQFAKGCDCTADDLQTRLLGYESQAAIRYWAYVRELLADDETQFEKRVRKGAVDLVNCLLNYGYAILYARVWQNLLAVKLNPFDSVLHVPQVGKPTLVYDVVELFRSQVVDRVVITLVQKGSELTLSKGLLSEDTRRLLAKHVMERLARYEKYRDKELKMNDIIASQCQDIASYFKDGTRYKPYVAKW